MRQGTRMPKRLNHETDNMDAMLIELQAGVASIIQDVESGMDDEIGSIRGQVEQIQHLLKDAIASLYDSFGQLDRHTSEQMKVMATLILDTSGESRDGLDGKNIFQRTNDASDVLKDLVAREIESSEQALTAFITMDKLKLQIKWMDDEIRRSSEVFNTMAGLTHIEGDDSAELVALISQEKKHQQNLGAVMKAIKNKFSKAHGRIDTLANRNRKDIDAARDSVEQLLKHVYDVCNMISSCRSRMTDMNGSIRKDLGCLVRNLQFEDIVSQSLGHTELYLNRMDGFVELISQGITSMQELKTDDIANYTGRLKQLRNDVMAYRQELRLEELNPVSQQNMNEGDVDLF